MKTTNLNQIDVVHKWANQLKEFKNVTLYSNRDVVKCINNKLYKNDLLIGIFIKKDIVFINNSDYGSSGWGAGRSISNYDVNHLIPSSVKIYNFSELLEDYSRDDTFVKWFVNQTIKYNEQYFNKISHYKRFIKNEVRKIRTYNSNAKFTLPHIPNYLLRNRIRKIKSTFVNDYHWGIYYRGWNRYYNRFQINATISKLLSNDLSIFFNNDEIKQINFQIWRETYGIIPTIRNNYLIPFKEAKKIYNDPIAKKELENKTIEKLKQVKHDIKEIEDKRKLKTLYIYYSNIKNWLLDKRSSVGLYNRNIAFIKLTKNNNVHTSLGVTITIEQAKLAYNLFKRYEPKDNISIDLSDRNYKISHYLVTGINYTSYPIIEGLSVNNILDYDFKDVNNMTKDELNNIKIVNSEPEPCLIIGCHKIPKSEINRFITYNNLNWND